uniref:uncharacterized protein LOC122605357 n=1 Tax=Erigeron canadensis TaxID=72917 RepID=UPI001CB984C4|nr:uncharacterized protein LOC122605357 [Erigeron canadensis]
MMEHIGVHLASRRHPNLPPVDLLTGPREEYCKFCLPLYEASIKCVWKATKDILDKRPELLSYSITENGETTLHVAASAKVPQEKREVFVRNLVDKMEKEDLALENEDFNTALYLAAAAGHLETVQIMVEKNRDLVTIPGGGRQMLPLHAAALFKKCEVVEYLFGKSSDLCDADGWNDTNRGWLLEKCVKNDMFKVALQIVKKYPKLGRRGNVLGILAQKPDAFCERKINPIIRSLISEMGDNEMVHAYSGPKVRAREGPALQLLRLILDDIMKLPKNEIDSILIRGPNVIKPTNKPVSSKVDQALELQKLISEHIVNMHIETKDILEQDSNSTSFIKGDQAMQLEKVISEHITKMQLKTQNIIRGTDAKDTHSSGALYTAAEMGNTIFLVELIRRYPDIMWKVNDSNQTIFHIAVENRHEGIYNMLYEIGYMKDSITSLDDENGNNMLHLVAKIAKKKKLEQVPRVMFQMQRELLWFKEVESMVNPSCIERKNKDGLTPHELFTKEHEDLLSQSVEWVKGTANQCIVVAALVATIAFAAAITVPGGNQDDGTPIFYQDTAYTIFILLDAASLFTSSTSTILFITLLTSQFGQPDFLFHVPTKFTLFLYTLFASIQLMILSFGVSFFVIYQKEMTWIPIIICVIAVLVYLYLSLQCNNMFLHIFRLMYGYRYLFKPKKAVLYFQNPML